MRVRISGILGVAALVAGVIVLATPEAGAQPTSGRSATPPLIDATTSRPLHSPAPTTPSPAAGSRALSIKVTSCSTSDLIAAITAVNSTGGTVELFPGCTYFVNCPDNGNNGLPVITNEVTIDGAGATISRSSARLLRFFEVDGSGKLALNNLTLSNGHAPDGGGAILVKDYASALTLDATSLTGNTADFRGGGILANGTVKVDNSTFSHNTATRGGGMEVDSGSLTVTNTTIAENTALASFGGGVLSVLNTAVFDHTRILNNTGADGGGIAFGDASGATVNNSVVAGNTGSGIYNQGSHLFLDSTAVVYNHVDGAGGGIAMMHYPGAATSAELRNSVVAFNTASVTAGGIYTFGGPVSLIATLVVNNTPNNCTGSYLPIPGCPD